MQALKRNSNFQFVFSILIVKHLPTYKWPKDGHVKSVDSVRKDPWAFSNSFS